MMVASLFSLSLQVKMIKLIQFCRSPCSLHLNDPLDMAFRLIFCCVYYTWQFNARKTSPYHESPWKKFECFGLSLCWWGDHWSSMGCFKRHGEFSVMTLPNFCIECMMQPFIVVPFMWYSYVNRQCICCRICKIVLTLTHWKSQSTSHTDMFLSMD